MAGEARPASISPHSHVAAASAGGGGHQRPDVAAIKSEVFALLSSRVAALDDDLPRTGVGLEWERVLSPIMIAGNDYGTRCSTALILAASGNAFFSEWTRDASGEVAGRVDFEFGLAG